MLHCISFSFHFRLHYNVNTLLKISPNIGILLKQVLIPNLLNNSLASSFFINLDFLLLHTAHFDNCIILQLLVFETFAFILSASILNFKQYDDIVVYIYILLINHLVFSYSFNKSIIFSSSHSFNK